MASLRGAAEGGPMSGDEITGVIIAVLLLVYLVMALINPERF